MPPFFSMKQSCTPNSSYKHAFCTQSDLPTEWLLHPSSTLRMMHLQHCLIKHVNESIILQKKVEVNAYSTIKNPQSRGSDHFTVSIQTILILRVTLQKYCFNSLVHASYFSPLSQISTKGWNWRDHDCSQVQSLTLPSQVNCSRERIKSKLIA